MISMVKSFIAEIDLILNHFFVLAFVQHALFVFQRPEREKKVIKICLKPSSIINYF
jgi:hypothetical protein